MDIWSTLGRAPDLPWAPGISSVLERVVLNLPWQGDCRPLGESRCQRTGVKYYFFREKLNDEKDAWIWLDDYRPAS